MTEITCYLHGSYPHSETLVAVARDAARGRRPVSDLCEQRRADQAALEALQRQAGLTFVSSGMLGWQDLFRSLVAPCPGTGCRPAAALVRHQRVCPDTGGARDRRARPALARRAAGTGRSSREADEVGTLPGPYTFSRVADTSLDRDALMQVLVRDVLRPAAEELAARGAQVIHLQEPWLAAHGIDDGCWPLLAGALRRVRDGLGVPVPGEAAKLLNLGPAC